MTRAEDKFAEFHQFGPRGSGPFAPYLSIPRRARRVGNAKYVLYRSDKLNPSTGEDEGFIDYIHEHDPGVHTYRADDSVGPMVRVPEFLLECSRLVFLGECLGFGYADAKGLVEAEPDGRTAELYTLPSGKALLVIEDKSRICAMMWGGKLGVESRGIVG